MIPAAFGYARPKSLDDAIKLLAKGDGSTKIIAGGQSLVPMLAFRLASPSLLVDLRKLTELRRIKITDAGVALGPWCAGATSRTMRGSQRHIRCSKPRSRMWRITRSAIAAPSAAASPTPIRRQRCQESL